MDAITLTNRIKTRAEELGFDQCGVCPAVAPPGLDRFYQWLDAGFDGEMAYLANRRDAYQSPAAVMAGSKSILMLTMVYHTQSPTEQRAGQGRVSQYASGTLDYHDVIHARLKQLVAYHNELTGGNSRGVVDSAPLLEREYAQLAGIGWIAKNTMLISKTQGSWFFLAALLSDQQLHYDAPVTTDHCGSCTACLDACPTNAFPQPYVLDATKCISYLTIELRSHVPESLREGIGDWAFGCDVCQQVCPWNNKSPQTGEPNFQSREGVEYLDLCRLFALSEDEFRELFRKTPLWRSKRRGILRNAALVLGNQSSAESVGALEIGLHDGDSLVRAASAWALRRIGGERALHAIELRLPQELDADVIRELTAAK
ncbi:MAG: epoxyqueuosine reductase [Pirellulaceae bacterium]|jgi:epoxyqueuosine reductase